MAETSLVAFTAEVPVAGDFDRDRQPYRKVRYVSVLHGERRFEVFLDSGDVIGSIVVPEAARRTDFLKQVLMDTGETPPDMEIGVMWGRLGERIERARNHGVEVTHA